MSHPLSASVRALVAAAAVALLLVIALVLASPGHRALGGQSWNKPARTTAGQSWNVVGPNGQSWN